MNKAGWIAGILILIIALGGAYFFISHEKAPQPVTSTDSSGNAAVGATGASTIITYTDTGFNPSPQSVAPGTTVTWENQSSHTMWIEGNGTSEECTQTKSQTVLNECQAVSKGGTFSFTFTVLGTFVYTNHDKDTDTGTVVVTDASASGPINPTAIPE